MVDLFIAIWVSRFGSAMPVCQEFFGPSPLLRLQQGAGKSSSCVHCGMN